MSFTARCTVINEGISRVHKPKVVEQKEIPGAEIYCSCLMHSNTLQFLEGSFLL